jgi:hypothetical protein
MTDLLLCDPHVVRHVGEDGRLVEVADVAVALAAEGEPRAFVLSDRHVALHPLQLLGRDERADRGLRVEAACDAHVA